MLCEFDYCIYHELGGCILPEISVNAYGMCDSCILTPFPEIYLNPLKKTQRKRLEEEHTGC